MHLFFRLFLLYLRRSSSRFFKLKSGNLYVKNYIQYIISRTVKCLLSCDKKAIIKSNNAIITSRSTNSIKCFQSKDRKMNVKLK